MIEVGDLVQTRTGNVCKVTASNGQTLKVEVVIPISSAFYVGEVFKKRGYSIKKISLNE